MDQAPNVHAIDISPLPLPGFEHIRKCILWIAYKRHRKAFPGLCPTYTWGSAIQCDNLLATRLPPIIDRADYRLAQIG